jgi:hypothetical protein
MFSLDDHFTSATNPRGQLLMQLTCIGSVFEFAGAPFFAFSAKSGMVFTLPFGQASRPQNGQCTGTILNLVSRPVEFCLSLCHATNGEFSNDAHGKCCRQPVQLRGEEKANRNTCQFKNPRSPLTTNDITFSNRNTKLPFSVSDSLCASVFQWQGPC